MIMEKKSKNASYAKNCSVFLRGLCGKMHFIASI